MNHLPGGSKVSLSLVIPTCNSVDCVDELVSRLEEINLQQRWEVIFVDDGSQDNTYFRLKERLAVSTICATLVRHTRNFGEHQAVLTGYRLATGFHIVNLDDDLQNPIIEAIRLWMHALETDSDVVYGNYHLKEHAKWRNAGSKLANISANFFLASQQKYYFSSFRCVKADIAKLAANANTPYPYIDGLLSEVTQSISTLTVHHDRRYLGGSSYTLRRLIRLWMNIVVNSSIMPLRLASLLAIAMWFLGMLLMASAIADVVINGAAVVGWASLMSGVLFFGGIQCLFLGILGEYTGRILLVLSGKPQSCVRDITEYNKKLA